MDGQRFDRLLRPLVEGPASRRRALRLLAGSTLGGLLARFASAEVGVARVAAGARCKRHCLRRCGERCADNADPVRCYGRCEDDCDRRCG